MDAFDYRDEGYSRKKFFSLIWNSLTGLLLLMSLCLGIAFVMIYLNPYIGINLFPPPTQPTLLELPTVTPTLRSILPATWTPTTGVEASPTISPSATIKPTQAEPTVTNTFLIPTVSLVPDVTPTVSGGMPYVVQQGNPVAILNIGHPDLGCNWQGVAGQAMGLNNVPVKGLFVQLKGNFGGQALNMLMMTGTATQYGAAGYEFTLGNQPAASSGSLWVQLIDQAGLPLSEKVMFDTFAECDKNLVLINFTQVP